MNPKKLQKFCHGFFGVLGLCTRELCTYIMFLVIFTIVVILGRGSDTGNFIMTQAIKQRILSCNYGPEIADGMKQKTIN